MADVDDLMSRLVVGVVAGAAEGTPLAMRLCRAAVGILDADGGAVTLAYTHIERVTLCATDATARRLEEIQDVLAQGPGPEAYSTGSYTRLDVDGDTVTDSRWPMLHSSTVADLGALTLHAIPMGRGSESIGVLSLYCTGPGRDIDLESAAVLGLAVGAALLADAPTQSDAGQGGWSERAGVHQATGMVVAQLGIGAEDATALLRAHAFAQDRDLSTVAAEVVSRRLVFSASPEQEIETS